MEKATRNHFPIYPKNGHGNAQFTDKRKQWRAMIAQILERTWCFLFYKTCELNKYQTFYLSINLFGAKSNLSCLSIFNAWGLNANLIHITKKFCMICTTPKSVFCVIYPGPKNEIENIYFITSKTVEKQSFLEVSVNKKFSYKLNWVKFFSSSTFSFIFRIFF